MTNSKSMLSVALDYIARGFAVVPVVAGGKYPAKISNYPDGCETDAERGAHDAKPDGAGECKHGYASATTDAEIVREWFAKPCRYNIGIACGAKSGGLVVIDLDVKRDDAGNVVTDGMATLRKWEAEFGALPVTLTSITGGGGRHLYYRACGSFPIEQYRNAVGGMPGIDVRAEGGGIVAPPSLHKSGRRYQWEDAGKEVAPVTVQVHQFLKDVGALACPVESQAEKPATGGKLPAVIEEGERNDTLAQYAWHLAISGIGAEAVQDALHDANNDRCAPPLPIAEVDRIAAGAVAKVARGGAGKKPGAPEMVQRLIESYGVRMLSGAPVVTACNPPAFGWDAVHRAILEECPAYTPRERADVCERIRLIGETIEAEEAPERYIAFLNGVYDTETGEMLPECPRGIVPVTISHMFNAETDEEQSPDVDAVERMLDGIADGDEATRRNIEEMMGECISRGHTNRHWWWLQGEGGNGKSTLCAAIVAMVGKNNATALQPRQFVDRFDPAEMVAKLVNVSDDVASDTVGANACAVAKKIVTGDALHVENKGMKPFKFEPFATLISACNDQPNLADTSEGMRRRVWVIPMTAKFTEGGGADVNMREAVTTEAAARYMLHLAVKGLARLQSYGRPTPNPRADAVTHELMVLSDPVAAYIADTGITPAELVERDPKDVYEDFAVWFANEGMPATAKPEQRRFTRRVCATFPGLYTEQNGRDARGRKRRAYRMK